MSLVIVFHFTSSMLNMFRILIHKGFSLLHRYHPKPATPKVQHTSKQEHTTNVVIQYKSRRVLMMDILMSETC